jgi:hypothetical protein
MIKEHDLVISVVPINEDIKENTIGVVLSISKDKKQFLVEFVNDKNETIGDGMTVVNESQVKLHTSV